MAQAGHRLIHGGDAGGAADHRKQLSAAGRRKIGNRHRAALLMLHLRKKQRSMPSMNLFY
jgi:hypothetical protein